MIDLILAEIFFINFQLYIKINNRPILGPVVNL